MSEKSSQIEVSLTLFRGLNGTNPSAFRVDADGISVFENPLPDYKFNLPIRAVYQGEKVSGIIAEIDEPMLEGGIADIRRSSVKIIGRCVFPIWTHRRLKFGYRNLQNLCLNNDYEQRFGNNNQSQRNFTNSRFGTKF